MIQHIKPYLVKLGPRNPFARMALKIYSAYKGFEIRFLDRKICIRSDTRELILAEKDFYLVPFTLRRFDQAFEEIEATSGEGISVLDFSGSCSRHPGLTILLPGLPEDDCAESYTHWYGPKPGDVVFDVGACIGLTTCLFARMVAPEGRVVAFEPDTNTPSWLETNVRDQNIKNATIVPKALTSITGTTLFKADGTMGAALMEHTVYGSTGGQVRGQTLSLPDGCAEFGIPQFIKMDIEGAEIAVIKSAAAFLRAHPINLASDSFHRMRDAQLTKVALDPLLQSLGYGVKSEAEPGQMLTWVRPRTG